MRVAGIHAHGRRRGLPALVHSTDKAPGSVTSAGRRGLPALASFHGTRPPAAAHLRCADAGCRRSPPFHRTAPGSAHLRCADAGCQPPPRQNQYARQQACRDRPFLQAYAAASTRRNIARSNAPRRRNSRGRRSALPGGRRSMEPSRMAAVARSCLTWCLHKFMSKSCNLTAGPYRSSLTFRASMSHATATSDRDHGLVRRPPDGRLVRRRAEITTDRERSSCRPVADVDHPPMPATRHGAAARASRIDGSARRPARPA